MLPLSATSVSCRKCFKSRCRKERLESSKGYGPRQACHRQYTHGPGRVSRVGGAMSFQRRGAGEFATAFGSLASYVEGDIEIINDDVRSYAFSNVFDVAASAAPYEK